MDRSWMKIRNRGDPTYIRGVDNFLDWACSQPGAEENRIRCPCKKCRNVIFKLRNEVRFHLLMNGFSDTYEVWVCHGESLIRSSSSLEENNDQIHDNHVNEDNIIGTSQQEILMDKSWMKIRNRAISTYVKGIDNFLDWACSQPGVNNRIRCPCNVCRNVKFKLRNEVRVHLLKNGFLDTYEVWEYHGESLIRSSPSLEESDDQIHDNHVTEDNIIATSQQKILMDKSWMKIRNRATPTYVKGIDNFLDWACSQPGVNNRIRCPCNVCRNVKFKLRNEVRVHLLKNGFLDTYEVWEYHGESLIKSSPSLEESNDQIHDNHVTEDNIITTSQQKILMDKSWMKIRNRATLTYVKGIDNFLDWACSQPGVDNRIRCPCNVCRNIKFKLKNEVRVHLLKNGFLDTYEVWEYHGESLIRSSSSLEESNDQIHDTHVTEDNIIATSQQKILMDKSWMKIRNRATPTYIKGIDNFLDWAFSQQGVDNRIRCPCNVCKNVKFKLKDEVRFHLLKNGFLDTYEVWEYHGEPLIRSSPSLEQSNDQIHDNHVTEDNLIVTSQQETLTDKSWMKIQDKADPSYIKGIDDFLDWACSQPGVNNRIRCPCKVCKNVIFKMRNEIWSHLLKNGFLDTYQVWEYHGESLMRPSYPHSEKNDQIKANDVKEADVNATSKQEILMDKTWMKIPRRTTPTYIKGIDDFLDWACSQPGVNNIIPCPCKVCRNVKLKTRSEVRVHLLKKGFLETYEVWEYHGESLIKPSSCRNERGDQIQGNDAKEILIDKRWMKIRDTTNATYIKGIDNFLDWACSQPGVRDRIRCPCKVCRNVLFKMRDEIRFHLLKNGFLDSYEVWEYHGESIMRYSCPNNERNDQIQDNDVEEEDTTATSKMKGFLETYEVWDHHGESLAKQPSCLNESNDQIQDNLVAENAIVATTQQKILMDKSWMKIRDTTNATYVKGIDNFLEWACSQPGANDRIRCPCKICRNVLFKMRNETRFHLLKNGFLDSYVVWEYHGESVMRYSSPHNERNDQIQDIEEVEATATSKQEVLMDKTWMKILRRAMPTYVKGVDNFLDWACSQAGVNNIIPCPCKGCRNVIFKSRNEVRVHLLKKGFLETYVVWEHHGESLTEPASCLNEGNGQIQDNLVADNAIASTSQPKIPMDKSWMKIRDTTNATYIKGIDNFLEWACCQPGVNNRIRCPCKICKNVLFKMRNETRSHLLKNGFLDTYVVWEYHGESVMRYSCPHNERNDQIQDNDVDEADTTATSKQDLLMDKTWMKFWKTSITTYVEGIDNFLDWACSQPGLNVLIPCPCKACRNLKLKTRNEVKVHILKKGFLETYEVWEHHGESLTKPASCLNEGNDPVQDNLVVENAIAATSQQKIPMDKSWMKIRDTTSATYIKGIDNFLEWACSQPGVNDRIRCPCKICKNVLFKMRNETRSHLLKNGFLDTYVVWEYHGESVMRYSFPHNERNDQIQDNDVDEADTTATSKQDLLMDKSWMKFQRKNIPTYVQGIDTFLDWACSQPGLNVIIPCPCKACRNLKLKTRNEVKVHLLCKGFLETYEVWEHHGESLPKPASCLHESNDQVTHNHGAEVAITTTNQQETLQDKSWMKIRNRANPTYIKGTDDFIEWACSQPGSNNRIRCPCKVCRNVVFKLRNEVRFHLLNNGFLDTYQVWEYHGESIIRSSSHLNVSVHERQADDLEEQDISATPQGQSQNTVANASSNPSTNRTRKKRRI